ncbi:MAG: hypothetical protein EP344_12625 [Bacteroidetes bacterium]|nr:MAG: hypothetical protein EP344_12625 [Bacteroidota bacterium]
MKVKLPFLLLVFLFLLLYSCQKDPAPAGAGHYTSGLFIVNEGPFGGAGSITWHNPETGETVQDVFSKANAGAVLGEFVQSLTLHNGKGYIVVNGANKVYVVNATTFEFLDTISGLALPRYLFPLDNDFGLISQWGADGLTGSVVKVDLNTLQIVQSIPTGKGPEKMIRQLDGLVLIPNSGGFGTDTTVSILNADNTAEQERLSVPGKNPGSAAVAGFSSTTQTPATFTLCQGSYLDPDPQGWTGTLDPAGNISLTIPPYGNDLCVAPDGRTMYFTAGGKVYTLQYSGLTAWLDQPAYGLACDPKTGYLYCADAKDFNSAGEVVVYTAEGERVGAFPTGIAPGEVVFIP